MLIKWQSEDERTHIERLMARGQTWEQATAQISEEKAARGLRVEMEKREIVVRSRDHAATRKLAEAAKLAALEGRIPIHPKSKLAREMQEATRAPAPAKLEEIDTDKAADGFRFVPTANPFDE